MGPLDAFWHLLNFHLPAVGVALIGAAGAKLIWRRELAGARWRLLAVWGFVPAAASLWFGLAFFGHDGRMATYAAMCAASALGLWWFGFRRGRR
jgi:hypothetical protein